MAGKNTDRKGKKEKVAEVESVPVFTLPDSLSCSVVDFPVIMKRHRKAKWDDILEESKQKFLELEEYVESKKEPIPKSQFQNTECDYIKNEVFVHLLPALVETLQKANIWEALIRQKCFFNGIDHIAQVLWNNNPKYPERKYHNLHIFNMPWVRKHLQEHPRPYYPKSWLWPEDYAATLIQKHVRQYFVQREDEVQEMRSFWRKLEYEQIYPEIDTNPLLLKRFAAMTNLKK